MSRTKKQLFSTILLCLLYVTPLEAMTRAEALQSVMTALNLPNPRSMESARSMGIPFPAEQFYPEIPATNAEALAFSFRAMGFEHEAKVMAMLFDEPSDLPSYLKPYAALGKSVYPKAPQSMINSLKEEFTAEDSRNLALWLRRCLTRGIKWSRQIHKDGLTLLVHREGVGRPGGMGSYLNTLLPSKVLPASYGNSPVFWAAIKAPAERAFIRTSPSIGAKKLPLSQIAMYSKAKAGINGGFFSDVKTVGTLVIDGIPASSPYRNRSAMGWNERGEVFFGSGYYRLKAITELGEVYLNGLNKPTPEGQLGLYTTHFGQIASQINGPGQEIWIRQGKIASFKDSMNSNHMMRDDEAILWARTDGIGFLADSKNLSIELEWMDKYMERASQVIQAGPMLLPSSAPGHEGFSNSTLNLRHPRTIVGYDGRDLWWIAVDGRSSWHSGGMSIAEAASLARDLGLRKALNLDGGGSTQLWWDGKTINRISDGRERPLPYAIVFR